MRGDARQQIYDLKRCAERVQAIVRESDAAEDSLGKLLEIACGRLGKPEIIGTLVLTMTDGKVIALRCESGRAQVEPHPEAVERGLLPLVRHNCRATLEQNLRSAPPAGYVHYAQGVQSELAVPILKAGHCAGVIDIASTRNSAFGDEDQFWLEHVVTLMELGLYSTARAHAEAVDVEKVLDDLLTAALESARLADGYAVIILADGDRVVPKRAAKVVNGQVIPTLPVGEQTWSQRSGLTGKALRTGQSVVVPDVDADPEYLKHIPDVKSEAVIPIISGRNREVVGALDIQSFVPDAFPPSVVAQVESLTVQVATALSIAQLSERLDREQRVLARLAKVAPAVVRNFSIDRVYDLILEAAFSLLPTASSAHMLTVRKHPESGERTLALIHRLDAPADRTENRAPRNGRCPPPLLEFHDTVGITGRAVRSQQTQYVEDIRLDADHVKFSDTTLSELAIPIMLSNTVIAVLNIESDALDAFSPRDQLVAELLAAEAGLALSNAQDFARKIELLNIVVAATREVLSSVDDSNLLIDAILAGAMRVTHAEDGYCALILKVGDTLRVKREAGKHLLDGRLLAWSVDDGLTGRAIREGHPIYVPDITKEPTYIPTTGTMRTDLVVPLFDNRNETVGAITLESPALNAFDEHAVDALQQFGPPVVSALIKSELVDSLKQRQQETIDLIRQVAHLLHRPVNTLRGELTSGKAERADPSLTQDAAWSSSVAAADFLKLIVEWLAAQAEVLGDPNGQRARIGVDVRALVAQACHAYRYYSDLRQVRLVDDSAPAPALAHVNREEMLGAFIELLVNAVKYSPEHGTVWIHVRQIVDEIHIIVEDEGRGIPQRDQERIFGRGARGSNVAEIQGSGLGLYFVESAVRRQGGSVRVDSPRPTPDGPVQGTRFTLRVPTAAIGTAHGPS